MHALIAIAVLAATNVEPLTFQLTFTKRASEDPFTGRVYVVLHRTDPGSLPRILNWFDPPPTFAVDVKDWKPATPLVVGDAALSHPFPLRDVKPGRYFVQAVMDQGTDGLSFMACSGNIYSKAQRIDLHPARSGNVPLTLNQVYHPPEFHETESLKLVEIPSVRLQQAIGRPETMRAVVILPPSYDEKPNRKYPIVFEIPGFGGTHHSATRIAERKPWDVDGVEMIWVVLNPECRLGHHVFADSENNGPWGKALTRELIPAIEKRFRAIGRPEARFVTGHSSGGWSSLWLQVTYPDVFGGCWSTSPDPVDFRDFQGVDLSAPNANLFTDVNGKPRPLSRAVGGRRLTFASFSGMEDVMGRGGQLSSFEAVFSPRGPDGPRKLWDRKSGAVDPGTVKAWAKYDIQRTLVENWDTLGPKLTEKLHIYMGEQDTFYLEGATKLLKEALANLGSDAVVELFPGKTHALVDVELRKRMNREMAAAYRAWEENR